MNRFGMSIDGALSVHLLKARSVEKAITEARAKLWEPDVQGDNARIYRHADGWRFVGIVTYDGRFIDERRPVALKGAKP